MQKADDCWREMGKESERDRHREQRTCTALVLFANVCRNQELNPGVLHGWPGGKVFSYLDPHLRPSWVCNSKKEKLEIKPRGFRPRDFVLSTRILISSLITGLNSYPLTFFFLKATLLNFCMARKAVRTMHCEITTFWNNDYFVASYCSSAGNATTRKSLKTLVQCVLGVDWCTIKEGAGREVRNKLNLCGDKTSTLQIQRSHMSNVSVDFLFKSVVLSVLLNMAIMSSLYHHIFLEACYLSF